MRQKLKIALCIFGVMVHSVGLAQITGQIFIVQKDQVVLRLAAVSVAVFSESYVRERFSEVISLNKDISNKLNYELMGVAEIASKAREELAKGDLSREMKIMDDNLKKSTREPDYASRYDEYLVLLKRRDLLEQAVENAEVKRKEVRDAVNEINKLDVFVASLKYPAYKAKTNADGLFKVNAARGNYVLLARASREILNGSREDYTWLVRVDTRRGGEEVLLSNDNLYGKVGCEECVNIFGVH